MRKKSTNEEKGSTNEPQKEKSRGKGADDGGKRRSGKDGSGKHTGEQEAGSTSAKRRYRRA